MTLSGLNPHPERLKVGDLVTTWNPHFHTDEIMELTAIRKVGPNVTSSGYEAFTVNHKTRECACDGWCAHWMIPVEEVAEGLYLATCPTP